MGVVKKLGKGTLKLAKKAGNTLAVKTKLPRPFVTKTKNLDSKINPEIKAFIEATKKIQELSHNIHFSHLEKLSRESKDKCKKFFIELEKEEKGENQLYVAINKYKVIRNKYLNELYKASKLMAQINKAFNEEFVKAINQQTLDDNVKADIEYLKNQINQIN